MTTENQSNAEEIHPLDVSYHPPPGVKRLPITFRSGEETLAGDLVLPGGEGPFPALLFVAGTGPQNRHGDFYAEGRWKVHRVYRTVSDRLAAAGIACLCYDKRGVAESTGGDRQPGDPPGYRDGYADVVSDVDDALAGLRFLKDRPEIDPSRLAVMGKSAGVMFACHLARRSDLPAAYVLWGGVHRDIGALMEHIYEQLLGYTGRGPEQRAFVEQFAGGIYKVAPHWRKVLAAAERGDDWYRYGEEPGAPRESLARLKQELADPIPEMFRFIQKPALVIHGDRDLNVPVDEAYRVRNQIQAAGNDEVTLVIVPGADHSMHVAPSDLTEDQRMRERLSHSSFKHPVSEFFLDSLVEWLKGQGF